MSPEVDEGDEGEPGVQEPVSILAFLANAHVYGCEDDWEVFDGWFAELDVGDARGLEAGLVDQYDVQGGSLAPHVIHDVLEL